MEPGGNNRLSEGRRCGQHTDLMFQHRVGGQLLLRSQLALKGHLQWLSAAASVVDDGPNIRVRQNLTDIVQTAAQDADVMRMFLGAADDTGLVVSRQAHGLRLVELWILECRDTQ